MKTGLPIKLLSATVAVCLMLIAGLGVYNWKLSRQLQEASTSAQHDRPWSVFSDSFNAAGLSGSASSPSVTMSESADKYTVVVTVPEGQEVELNTNLTDNQLTISGTVHRRTENATDKLFGRSNTYSTRSSSQFSQTITLPTDTDGAAIDVKHEDSTITITIPTQVS